MDLTQILGLGDGGTKTCAAEKQIGDAAGGAGVKGGGTGSGWNRMGR